MTFLENKEYFKSTIAGGFDITYRDINVDKHTYFLVFLNCLTNAQQMGELVKGLYQGQALLDVFAMYCASSAECVDRKVAITSVLSGQCLLLHGTKMYLVEVRNYPNQPTNEASNEQSIRGAHDSFVENIILNVGLLRRRLRDPNLRIKLHQEGSKSRTDIAYLYIEDLVDENLLKDFETRLQSLNSVEVLYERTLCDALYGKSYNPYPSVRYCERPDICSIHLMQGYLIVLVDNSFTALILPTTFFELTKQIEEYTQTSVVAIFIRVVRLMAIVLSIYILPFWILIETMQEPTIFSLPLLTIDKPAYVLFQILFVELLIEWIRLSFIHTPAAISGVMGFLFIFLLGESAIKLHLYTEVILVLVVLCNIGNFVTPNYELSLANKCIRFLFVILTTLTGLLGFSISILIHFCILLYTRNEHHGYLYPLIPFDAHEVKRLLLGSPVRYRSIRTKR